MSTYFFANPKLEVDRLSVLCKKRVGPEKEIHVFANDFQQKANLSSKDAIHVACAYYAKCKYFVTCDDVLVKRAKRLNLDIKVMNPVDYIRNEEKNNG